MRFSIFAASALLGGCMVTSTVERESAVVAIVRAERAFATRASDVGWISAFREFAAPDGQLAQHELVSAPAVLAATPDDGDRSLFWWPDFAGVARSGDLGFTTGGFSADETRDARGQYFTVWRRQGDGSWRWIFDGGPGPVTDPPAYAGPTSAVRELPVALQGVGSASRAVEQVSAIERESSTARALAERLAPDAHVYRRGRARSAGGAASMENMTIPSADIAYTLKRVEASAAGDLVFALGEANWVSDGQARNAYFARIWQYRSGSWFIVYDQLMGRPPPPEAAN